MAQTICNFRDIDIYLLYFLDFKTITLLIRVSKNQNELLLEQIFIRELYLLKQNEKPFKLDDIIDFAAKYNYMALIKWYDQSTNEFIYTQKAINRASRYGHIKVLEWFRDSKYEFKYSEAAINRASLNGHINLLEWFRDSKYEFKYTVRSINWASEKGARRRLRFHRDLIRRRRENA